MKKRYKKELKKLQGKIEVEKINYPQSWGCYYSFYLTIGKIKRFTGYLFRSDKEELHHGFKRSKPIKVFIKEGGLYKELIKLFLETKENCKIDNK